MRAPVVSTLLLLFVGLPQAAADDWSDGLHAELERADLEAALKSYAKVAQSTSPRAAAATRRQILLLGAQGEKALASRQLAYLRTFPKQALGPELQLLERDPAAFVQARQAAWKKHQPGGVLFSRSDVALDPDYYLQLWQPIAATFDSRLAPKRERKRDAKHPWRRSLRFLNRTCGLNVLFLGKLTKPFACDVKAAPRRAILRSFCRTQGVGLRVGPGALILGPPKRLTPVPAVVFGKDDASRFLARRLSSQTISMFFPDVPLGECLDFLRDITGLNYVALPTLSGSFTFHGRDLQLRDALRLLAYSLGAQVRSAHGAIVLGKDLSRFPGPPPTKAELALNPQVGQLLTKKKLSLNVPQERLDKLLLDHLPKLTGLKIVLAPGVRKSGKAKAEVYLRLRNLPLGDLLHLLLRPRGLTHRITRKGLRIESLPAK